MIAAVFQRDRIQSSCPGFVVRSDDCRDEIMESVSRLAAMEEIYERNAAEETVRVENLSRHVLLLNQRKVKKGSN